MRRYGWCFLSFMVSGVLFGATFESKEYHFAIDVPATWHQVDTKKKHDAYFVPEGEEAFLEVVTLSRDYGHDLSAMARYLGRWYNLQGAFSEGRFCRFDALRGEFSRTMEAVALKVEVVVFTDSHFFYVVMAGAKTGAYVGYRDRLRSAVHSFRLFYDGVTYRDEDPLPEPPPQPNAPTSDSDDYSMKAQWSGYDREFRFRRSEYLQSIQDLARVAEALPRSRSDFWPRFYNQMYRVNADRARTVVEFFRQEAKDRGWDAYQLASNVVAMIQGIPYQWPEKTIPDPSRWEHRLDFLPLNEVAWYNRGDCDTKSLFLLTILKQLGFQGGLFQSSAYRHAMVGLAVSADGDHKAFNNRRYYFVESTAFGWPIGKLPPEVGDLSKWEFIPIE